MKQNGWRAVKFGEVVKLNKERVAYPVAEGVERYVGLEHLTPEDLRIRSWGLVAEGTTFTNAFRSGQVLFGKRRAYQRKVAVADFSGVCSGDIYVFEPNDPQVLLPELLPFICQTEGFFNHAVGTSAGSLSPRTNWTQLANYEFALPPLEEQRRIVELLITFERTQEELINGVEMSTKLRKSVALHLFEKDKAVSRKLETVIQDSLYGPRFSSDMYDETGAIAQLRTTDIDDDGNIFYDQIPRARLDPDEYKTHLLRDGDLVISRSGTCGITAVFREQQLPMIAAAFLIRLRTNREMLPGYLHEYLSSPIGRQLTASLSRGGVQKNINGSNLLAQQIPCPSLERQQEVVNALAQIRAAKTNLQKRLEQNDQIKNTMLNALAGEE